MNKVKQTHIGMKNHNIATYLEISMRYSVIFGKVLRRNQIIQNIFIERQRKLENELQKKNELHEI